MLLHGIVPPIFHKKNKKKKNKIKKKKKGEIS
jgi:hypothetical protein